MDFFELIIRRAVHWFESPTWSGALWCGSIAAAFLAGKALRGKAPFARGVGNRVIDLLCWAPAVWLLGFGLLVLTARFRLGYWPYPPHTDPDLPVFGIVCSPLDPMEIPLLYSPLWTGLLLLPFVGALVLPGHALTSAWLHERRWDRIVVLAIGYLLVVSLVVLDPGDFFDWFLD